MISFPSLFLSMEQDLMSVGYSLEHIYLTNLVHTKKEKGKDYIK